MERTIGVAIGAPPPWGPELDGHRAATGDPAAALIPAHVTLLGPTPLPEALVRAPDIDERIHQVLARAAGLQSPFVLRLRGTGTFRPITKVVFVAIAAGIAECEVLSEAIRTGPLERTLAHPYHPHVTVGHDVPEPALDQVFERLAGYTADFTVDHFTLYEHRGDGGWEPVRDYPLTGPAAYEPDRREEMRAKPARTSSTVGGSGAA